MMSRGNKKKKGIPQAWYYDACTLENTSTYKEMLRQNGYKNNSYISHLVVGEAISNIFHKKGLESTKNFIDLYHKMVDIGKLKVVGNDATGKIYQEIIKIFPELSITDALHLATSVRCKCNIFITSDSDLYNLKREKVKELGQKYGIPNLKIKQVKLEK